MRPTFGDLLSAVDLSNLLLNQLVTLLADIDDLCTRHAELRHGSQNLFRDLGSSLVLGESIGVVESVIYLQPLALLPCIDPDGCPRGWSCAGVCCHCSRRHGELAWCVFGGVFKWRGALGGFQAHRIQRQKWAARCKCTYRSPWSPTWWAIDGAQRQFLEDCDWCCRSKLADAVAKKAELQVGKQT